jgi:type II secretory pathway component PulK
LDEIESLKAAVHQKRQILIQSKKKRKHAETKNGAIKHPYENLKHDVESLANKADKFDSVKTILSMKKTELKLKEDTLKQLKWKHEIMFQQFELMNVEKKQKQKDLIQASLSLQQRERFASTLLKKENDT